LNTSIPMLFMRAIILFPLAGILWLNFSPLQAQDVALGEKIFTEKCVACHSIGQGRKIGPDLKMLSHMHDDEWTAAFINAPKQVIDSGDPYAQALFKEYGLHMPDQDLDDHEMSSVLQFIHHETKKHIDKTLSDTGNSTQKYKVLLTWKMDAFEDHFSIYEADPEANLNLTDTFLTDSLSNLPVTQEFIDGKLEMVPGEIKRIVVVYHNPSADPKYFFVTPDRIEPIENRLLGFNFIECLCGNDPYYVPPGQYWYRIMDLKMTGDKMILGDSVIEHTVYGLTLAQIKGYKLNTPNAAAN